MTDEQKKMESWKSIIDFTKVVITFSTTLLVALITYLVLDGRPLEWSLSLVTPALLVISIWCSFKGFGYAIATMRGEPYNNKATLYTNLGAALLLLSIFTLFLIKPYNNNAIDVILLDIEKQTAQLSQKLSPKSVTKFELNGQVYKITYINSSTKTEVSYSITDRRITNMN